MGTLIKTFFSEGGQNENYFYPHDLMTSMKRIIFKNYVDTGSN